jgi:hypothetical protein
VLTPTGAEVARLVRLDASDVASTPGSFISVTGGDVVVLDGTTLKTLAYDGTVQTIGHLATVSGTSSEGNLVVSPDRSQWLYSVNNTDTLDATIHLGSATSDRVLTTFRSPDGNGMLVPFAWTASGTYFNLQATGIGGAGPFLAYYFPLWRFDMGTLKATPVSPACPIVAVTTDGTAICRSAGYTITPPGGASHAVPVAGESAAVMVSSDGPRVALAHNGGSDTSAFYQMATFGIADTTAADFGPADYVPRAWLPDGRLIAAHQCIDPGFQGAACDASKDGTYIFSADGTSSTLFFRWPPQNNSTVVASLPGNP